MSVLADYDPGGRAAGIGVMIGGTQCAHRESIYAAAFAQGRGVARWRGRGRR